MILNPNEETTKLGPQQPGTRVTHPAPFRTNMVVFNQKGRIINQAMLGERFYAYFKNLKLDRSAQNKLQTLTTSTGTFRTLLIKAPKYSADPQYAGHYVLILQNTDAQEAAIRSFRQVLIVTIILFGHWHSACHTGCPHVLCGQLSGHGSGNRISLPTQHTSCGRHLP